MSILCVAFLYFCIRNWLHNKRPFSVLAWVKDNWLNMVVTSVIVICVDFSDVDATPLDVIALGVFPNLLIDLIKDIHHKLKN